MTTDYDAIAREYQQAKLQPWRTYIEAHSLLDLVGDVQGLDVLDVACGEGFYTRLLRRAGAGSATGVDLSAGMIDLAKAAEARDPLGIDYRVADAMRLPPSPQFDLVVAAYLLNYARDRAELLAMCQGLARVLRPGGRFVTVNSSPLLDFHLAPSYRKYGFETRIAEQFVEGSPITWTFHLENGSFSIENYYLDREIHDAVLGSAGFGQVCWHRPRLAAHAPTHEDPQHWNDFLEQSPIALLECVKS